MRANKKKWIAYLMALFWFQLVLVDSGYAQSIELTEMSVRNGVWSVGTASPKMTMPALVSPKNLPSVTPKWLPVGMSSATLARVLTNVWITAGVWAALTVCQKLADTYFNEKEYKTENNAIGQNVPTITPTAGVTGDLAGGFWECCCDIHYAYVGAYHTQDSAAVAANGWIASHPGLLAGSSSVNAGGTYACNAIAIDGNKWWVLSQSANGTGPHGQGIYNVFALIKRGELGQYTAGPNQFLAVPETQPQTTIEQDVNADNDKAMQAVLIALQQVAQALQDQSHWLRNDSARWNSIRNEINSAVTAGQVTEVTGQTPTTPGEVNPGSTPSHVSVDNMITAEQVSQAVINALAAKGLSSSELAQAITNALPSGGTSLTQAQAQQAVNDALTAKGLSTAEIQTAIQTALTNAYNQQKADVEAASLPTVTAEALPDAPTKLSITSILQTFMGQIGNLPFFSFFQSLSVGGSGSSCFSISLPGLMGGASGTYEGCLGQWQNIFDLMGSALLSIVGVRWTIYLFE